MKACYALSFIMYMISINASDINIISSINFNLNDVSITLLKNHPEHIDELCKMWHDVLGKNNHPDFEKVKEDYTKYLHSQAQDNELPLALIALLNNKPVGLCQLRPNCIPRKGAIPWCDEHPDKKPWLTLFVASAFQRKGVGTKLVKETLYYAQDTHKFTKAYIATEEPDLKETYLKKGCPEIARTTCDGKPAWILEIIIEDVLNNKTS